MACVMDVSHVNFFNFEGPIPHTEGSYRMCVCVCVCVCVSECDQVQNELSKFETI